MRRSVNLGEIPTTADGLAVVMSAEAVPQSELHNLRAEEALQEALEAERRFLDRLKTLSVVERELSRIDSFDLLCYQAVEWGRSRLGFERLSLWLFADSP